jgi:ornithine cyclodeaminase/alanine dehydrogenase-like protein (mu-crystallin family)
MLLLSENDVRQLLPMELALDAVEQAFRAEGRDQAQNILRARCQTDRVMLHLLGGADTPANAIGYKAYTTGREGARFHVGLFDGATGVALALIQADALGQLRTGAASGVATKYMAREDADLVGLIGTGKQAKTQAWAVSKIRKIRRLRVFSRSEENRKAFVAEMTPLCQCDIEPVARPEEAVRDMDIVLTATTSKTPVLAHQWLGQGTHICAVGSNFLSKAELDVGTFRRAKSVVVDSKDQARLEAGDFVAALEEGVLHWSDIHELSHVVVGKYRGRAHPEDVTVFKSLGLGLEDVAVAARVYAAALAAGIGQRVDF